jgi:acetyltransferase
MEYPAQYESKFRLDDGTEIYVRPIRPDDVDRMARLFEEFSDETVYLRFFSAIKSMSIEKLRYCCEIDYENHMALVASILNNSDEILVGVARYVVTPNEGGGEFAIVVADSWQNRRIGTTLLRNLIEAAKDRGIERLHAPVRYENRKALAMFRNAGYRFTQSTCEPGVSRVEFGLTEFLDTVA